MAVTNESSAQYKDVTDPRTYGGVGPQYGRELMVVQFEHDEAVAGDATSIQSLVNLQPGRYVIYPKLSYIMWSAFGAARTLDIGLSAYVNEAGTTVSAAPARFDDDIDVSSAGGAAMGSDMVIADGPGIYINVAGTTGAGVTIISTVAGGTIPVAAKLYGYLVLSKIA